MLITTGTVLAFTYVTTNEDNILNTEGPYVEVVSVDTEEVVLSFGNFGPGVHCFEYRTDGDTGQSTGTNPYFPELDLYPYFCLTPGDSTEMTFEPEEYVEIRVPFGAEQDFYFDWTRFDILYNRTAEITSPEADEYVYGLVDFTAYLDDDDIDPVQWAVREGTCDAGVNTVFGNVDGHSDVATIDTSDSSMQTFSFTADMTGMTSGSYCFIYNPKEDAGESNIRETVEFNLVVAPPREASECKKDGWMTFDYPTFRNQGDCASWVQSNENATGNRKDN